MREGEYIWEMRPAIQVSIITNNADRLLINGDPCALICFCVDVSQSMDEWWIEEGGLRCNTGSGFSDGHNVEYFDLAEVLRTFQD